MIITQTVEIPDSRRPYRPASLDERIAEAAVKGADGIVALSADPAGNVLVDKDRHPELYDWAANG